MRTNDDTIELSLHTEDKKQFLISLINEDKKQELLAIKENFPSIFRGCDMDSMLKNKNSKPDTIDKINKNDLGLLAFLGKKDLDKTYLTILREKYDSKFKDNVNIIFKFQNEATYGELGLIKDYLKYVAPQ